jgi:hypothetical protein
MTRCPEAYLNTKGDYTCADKENRARCRNLNNNDIDCPTFIMVGEAILND